MKFVANGSELGNVLTKMSRQITGRNLVPEMTGLRLKTKDGRLAVSWTDLYVTIVMDLEVEVEEEGERLLPGKLMTELVKSVVLNSKTNVSIESAGKFDARIKAENWMMNLNGYQMDDRAAISEVDGDPFTLSASIFTSIALKVAPAAEHQGGIRPVLESVQFDFKDKSLSFAAADGFRLAVLTVDDIEVEEGLTVLVPARSIEIFQKLAKRKDDIEVTIDQSGNKAGVFKLSAPGVSLVAPLVDGQYPDVASLVPDDIQTTVRLNRKELIQCIGAVTSSQLSKTLLVTIKEKPKSRAKKKPWIFLMEGGDLNDTNREAKTSGNMDVKIDGSGGEQFGVNSKFLLDALKVIGTETVIIECQDRYRPITVRPDGDEKLVYVIMPMMATQSRDKTETTEESGESDSVEANTEAGGDDF